MNVSEISDFLGLDGDLAKRISAAKKKAESVFYGKTNDFNEEILRLHHLISVHYNIPLFDDYFKNRTIDELIFEVELIKLSKSAPDDRMESIVQKEENRPELEGLFDDWEEESKNMSKKQEVKKNPEEKANKEPEWVDISKNEESDDDFLKKAKEFMNTGEFITGEDND